MNTAGLEVFGVFSPGDSAQLWVDPLTPVEPDELRAEPSLGVDLAVEALRPLSSIEAVVAGAPRSGSV
jgi:hypothetical protein